MNCKCHNFRDADALIRVLALVAAVTLPLPGCGGGVPSAGADAAPASATPTAQAASAEPLDAGARTRQGRYLTSEQARALARQLDDRLVTVEARCCGPDVAELDVLIAFGVQAAADLPNDAPFVVSGTDLRQAAAVANRLSELGAGQVHLITR